MGSWDTEGNETNVFIEKHTLLDIFLLPFIEYCVLMGYFSYTLVTLNISGTYKLLSPFARLRKSHDLP